jgi:hypothetical protein
MLILFMPQLLGNLEPIAPVLQNLVYQALE